MILTIFVVFISFVGLIIIHEFGHFILAKKFGIEVEEFGIGFPPRLLGKKIGETIYSINLLPLGGFVKIRGEDGGLKDPRSFGGKPIWQRYLVILGGVVAFWIIAAVILSVVAGGWGSMPIAIGDDMELNDNLVNPRIQVVRVFNNTPAQEAGLRQGDIIADFDKRGDFQEFMKENRGEEVTLNIKRGGAILEKKIIADPLVQIYEVTPDTSIARADLRPKDIILGFYTVADFQEFIKKNRGKEVTLNIERDGEMLEKKIIADPLVQIYEVTPDTSAARAGLRPKDIILGFYTVVDFQDFIKNHQHQEITLNIKRNNEALEKSLKIEEKLGVIIKESPGRKAGETIRGADLFRVATKKYPWYSVPLVGLKDTGHYTAQIVYVWAIMGGWALGLIDELPQGIEEEDMRVAGPVGIFVTMGEFFQIGTDAFLRLIALIAIALAMINILPIPALDGGRMAFLTVEAIRGKPMNYKIEQKINTVFFILLIGLMIFITIRFDIPAVFSG